MADIRQDERKCLKEYYIKRVESNGLGLSFSGKGQLMVSGDYGSKTSAYVKGREFHN